MFGIMAVLSHGDSHGYAIMRAVELSTGGAIRLPPGTLYRTLKQLLQLELIAEVDERPVPELDDQRRRYYRLTGLGFRVAESEAKRIEAVAKLGRLIPRTERSSG